MGLPTVSRTKNKNKKISGVVVGMIWLTGARGEIRVAVRTCEVGRYGEDVAMNEFSAVRKKKEDLQ